MNPIINPWFFYFISVTNVLKGILLFVGGVGTVIFVIAAFCIFADEGEFDDEDNTCKGIKKAIIIGVIMLVLGIFTPSSDTCYQMLAASLVTPDNIETVKDNTKDLVDYIIDIADQLSDADEDKDD